MKDRPSESGSASANPKAPLGALAISIIIHGTVFLFVGGYVIYEGVIQKTSFVQVDIPLGQEIDEAVMPEIEQALDTPDVPQPDSELVPSSTQVTESAATPSDILISTGPNPSFSLPPAVSTPTAVPRLGGEGSGSVSSEEKPVKAGPSTTRVLSSLFGSSENIPGGLVGTLYDLKQTRQGAPTEMADSSGLGTPQRNRAYIQVLNEMLQRWDSKKLSNYYRANRTLHITQIFMPRMNAIEVPKAFDVQKEVTPTYLLMHYTGAFNSPRSGTFRFVGYGDDVLAVRFDRKFVLNAGLANHILPPGQPREEVGNAVVDVTRPLWASEWIDFKEGQTYPLEILLGEAPGGAFGAFLLIEEKGATYKPRAGNRGPLLPVFQTAPTKIPEYIPEKGAPEVAKKGFAAIQG